jgi:hypothetical protein
LETLERDNFTIKKVVLKPEAGICLPALLFQPKPFSENADIVLYLNGEGKEAGAAQGGPIERLLQDGKSVFAVDLRGMGETAHKEGPNDWTNYFGAEWINYFSAYMLDKTYVGMRAQDIFYSAQYLNSLKDKEKFGKIHLLAVGEAGVPALHAAALEPQLFETVELRNSLISWADALHHTITENQLTNAVHGALKYYDLPDLAASIPEGKLKIEAPVNAVGELIESH